MLHAFCTVTLKSKEFSEEHSYQIPLYEFGQRRATILESDFSGEVVAKWYITASVAKYNML